MVTPPPKRRLVEIQVHAKENVKMVLNSPMLNTSKYSTKYSTKYSAEYSLVKPHKGIKNAVMFEHGVIVISSGSDMTIRANDAIAKITSVEKLGSPILTSIDPSAFDTEYKCIMGFTSNPNIYVAVKQLGCKNLDTIDSYIRTAIFQDQSSLNIIYM